jgi:nitroreductase
MTLLDIIQKRYSVRNFKKDPVPDDMIKQILEAGRLAPTGANTQPQRLIVIREQSGLDKIKKAGTVYNAPLAIIVCGDHSKVWKRPFDGKTLTDIDTSIVTDHMMLEATELGLGSVWICYFKPDIIKTEFNIPDHIEPIHILAIGYENENGPIPKRHTTRKPVDETVFGESYNQKLNFR